MATKLLNLDLYVERGEICMNLKLKDLSDQVIVITGASSGIGLVTARMAAKRGARVVLNSRNDGSASLRD